MIIITGGCGFIGSNIVHALNKIGKTDVLVVDDLTDGAKFNNIVDCQILDYRDKDDFLEQIKHKEDFVSKIEAIFHEGACSDTTEWNGKYMLNNNYQYSKTLLHYCLDHKIQYIYASSAATYGANTTFSEQPENESPLNVYGYSKLLFDQYVRRFCERSDSQVVGLRYFNVYGPREQHKGSMASVAFHLNNQIQKDGVVRLFEGCDNYANGEQRRDFIFVEDVAKVNLWFLQHPKISGIFNVGAGRSQTFNDVANSVLNWHKTGTIQYVPFPNHLRGHYQSFTEANIDKLRKVGYLDKFRSVEEGVKEYLDWLNS